MTNEQPDATHPTRMLAKTMAAALAASRAEGSGVFGELAARLGEILEVDAAMIARYDPADPRRAMALATWLDGRLLQTFEYDMEGTPCRAMLDRESRFVASGVHEEFTPGTLFHAQGFDSYAAHSIVDAQGRRSGLIVAMHRRPMTAPAATEAVLRIFAVRAAAELERERAGRELRQSEASYRAIFEASEDAIFVHDWDTGAILDVSPKAADLYGFSREALRQLRIGDISVNVPPYTEVEAMRHVQRARDSEAPLRFEWHARHRDGRLMWNEVTLKRAQIAGEPRVLAFVRDITDRKAADETLRLREEQYRAIFNASADALMLWNSRLQRVDVNSAHQKIFGFAREEVVGRGFEGLPYPEEYARPRIEMIRRALAGETIHAELEAIRKDGRRIITEMRTIPFSHRGEPHVLQIARDVTESRTADARLRASEEQYRAIFNASADALVLWDSQYRRVDVNLAYQKMYGWERDEVIGCGYEHPRFSPEYARPRLELVRRALAGESCHAELEAVRRDGTRVLTEVHAIPFRHRGEPHVLAIARDITERKRAEQALRAGEQQYRAIFDASADALVLRDADFRIVDVNATYEAMSGFPRDMVLGVDRVIANPPEVAAEIQALHARALAGEPIHFDTILLRRDGARYDLELRGVPIQHRGAPHVLYIGRDVTARKQAENKRRELESQLLQAQKMEAIGQLTGGIAHDFNNILTSVMGYMALAAERPATEADPKLQAYLEQAQHSCHRARDLIQQMLAFSRGRRGDPRPVALGPLVNESTRMLQATLPATLDLVSSVEGDPTALVDPVQVHQILLNLCINARDAMNETGRITVKARRVNVKDVTCTSCRRSFSGTFAELAVIDSGDGIPPEVSERMFEPFFTTKDIGRGTGMGLSIVHGVVHEHAGHVVVESRRSEGTTFRVLLPLASAATAAIATQQQGRGTTRVPLRGRVLLVEDEQSVLGFMRELLQGWGLTVIAAGDPSDALRWFTQQPDGFDLALTDQTMPGMTGIELARALVAQRADLPVLLYSGRSELLNSEALSAAGVRRVLAKPVDREALRDALKELLPQSRQVDAMVDPGFAAQ